MPHVSVSWGPLVHTFILFFICFLAGSARADTNSLHKIETLRFEQNIWLPMELFLVDAQDSRRLLGQPRL